MPPGTLLSHVSADISTGDDWRDEGWGEKLCRMGYRGDRPSIWLLQVIQGNRERHGMLGFAQHLCCPGLSVHHLQGVTVLRPYDLPMSGRTLSLCSCPTVPANACDLDGVSFRARAGSQGRVCWACWATSGAWPRAVPCSRAPFLHLPCRKLQRWMGRPRNSKL